MSFADNLKQYRKEKGISQEELAQRLEVSRQAISKWESGEGYPEVEKLLALSQVLGISLDALMATDASHQDAPRSPNAPCTAILITSPNENVILSCGKVVASQEYKGGKSSPKFALFGIGSASAWGENATFLGWYADREQIGSEIAAIQHAMESGAQAYTLQFCAKTKRRFLGLTMVE